MASQTIIKKKINRLSSGAALIAVLHVPCFLKPSNIFKLQNLFYITGVCTLLCFEQYWSSSGDSKIANETAVLSTLSSTFGHALVYEPMCPIGDGLVVPHILSCVAVKVYIIKIYIMDGRTAASSAILPSPLLGSLLRSWGHAVAWLVEALCYKPERRGFDS
jgi:hypothetical protein